MLELLGYLFFFILLGGAGVIVWYFFIRDDGSETPPQPSLPSLPNKDGDGNDVPTYDELINDYPSDVDSWLPYVKWGGTAIVIAGVVFAAWIFFIRPTWRKHRERLKEIEFFKNLTPEEKKARIRKATEELAGKTRVGIYSLAMKAAFDMKDREAAHKEIDRLFEKNPIAAAAGLVRSFDEER